MNFKDHFSTQAKDYARYRPSYPQALFEFLASLTPEHTLAWDAGTGNGQAAWGLAPFYDRVIATDPSEKQILQATPHPKITYQIAPAEKTGIPSKSVDLVTVAQAFHWFQFDRFFAELRRVAKSGGVIAVWCYFLFECSPDIDAVVYDYYTNIVGPYWPTERRHVEEKYRDIPFPFEEVSPPEIFMEKAWDLNAVLGYLGTWSATQKFIEKNHFNPLLDLEAKLKTVWKDPGQIKKMRWKIHSRLGRVT